MAKPAITRETVDFAVVPIHELEVLEATEEELLHRELQAKLTAAWYNQAPEDQLVVVF